MLRQIVGYVPSTVIPAAVSFVMIYVYTRLLTPAKYGSFSLVFSFILVAQTSLFFAIPMALTRFYPQALAQDRRETFLSACYTLFYGLSSLMVLSIGSVSLFVPVAHPGLWVLTTLVLIARAAVVVNQSVNRISFKMGRFNTIECAHAVLGPWPGHRLHLLVGRFGRGDRSRSFSRVVTVRVGGCRALTDTVSCWVGKNRTRHGD